MVKPIPTSRVLGKSTAQNTAQQSRVGAADESLCCIDWGRRWDWPTDDRYRPALWPLERCRQSAIGGEKTAEPLARVLKSAIVSGTMV